MVAISCRNAKVEIVGAKAWQAPPAFLLAEFVAVPFCSEGFLDGPSYGPIQMILLLFVLWVRNCMWQILDMNLVPVPFHMQVA